MRRFMLLTLLSCLIFTCTDDDELMPIEPTTNPPIALNFLALGDSYTIGTAVSEEERWPVQLAAELKQPEENSPTYDLNVDIIATNGWTTADLINGINARTDLGQDFDLVSLLIGVNNQYQGMSLSNYRAQFRQLLENAIILAGNQAEQVVVVSIPDYAYTPFGGGSQRISDEIDQFNTAARIITESYNVPFLDITPISRQAQADPALVAGDNLHPSGKQYARWVDEVIAPAVRALGL